MKTPIIEMEMISVNEKFIHIIIAYIFNIILIVMSFAMMEQEYNQLQIAFIVLGVLYLIYWLVCNRKSYIPWMVYLHFGIGAVVQILLNSFGVVPEDGGFFPGLGQFFYVVLVVIHAVLVGIMNLILFLINKKRK